MPGAGQGAEVLGPWNGRLKQVSLDDLLAAELMEVEAAELREARPRTRSGSPSPSCATWSRA